jgi:hypothetical protein
LYYFYLLVVEIYSTQYQCAAAPMPMADDHGAADAGGMTELL